jgi:polyhydroxyalkanoate synthesis regulator phasin
MAAKTSKKKSHKQTSRKATSAPTRKKAKPAPHKRISMRERVHDLTLKAVRDGELKLRDLPRLAQEVIEEAASGLNNAVPQSSRNVLRQVVDGLTDATAATAKSTRAAVTSMTRRGAQFVSHDASKTIRELRDLEGDFITALQHAGKSLKGAAKDEMDAIVKHARRAGTKIRPATQSALKAADGHMLELTRETAKAGVRATRSALTNMLHGASGLLQGLGDAVGEPRRASPKRKASTRRR